MVLIAAAANGASPRIDAVAPKGAPRGREQEVVLRGQRLNAPQEVLFYRPGLRFKSIAPVEGKEAAAVKAVFEIPADCPLGEHPFRLRTAAGLSEVDTFFVGALPAVDETEPNSDFAQPQKVPLNCTVAGVVASEDVDYYAVEAKKGQRITAEVEGIRLGQAMFDPSVAILDARRFELAACDDSALLRQDPVASILAPEDGTYVVLVREASYGGSDRCAYRLHVGTFPRPATVYPAGGKAGETLELKFLGDVAGAMASAVTLPGSPQTWPVFAQQNGEWAPSPNLVRVSPFPNVLEQEPNDTREQATKSPGEPPLACNGLLEKNGDEDWFSFAAKKGQAINVSVFARRLRSPLDPVVEIYGPGGNRLAENDDSEGPDSIAGFTAPDEGVYSVKVRDHLGQGSPVHVYRAEVTLPAPSLALTVPVFKKDTQERQAVSVARGNRFATLVGVRRENVGGDLALAFDGLPAGLRAEAPPVPPGLNQAPVLFEAAPDAPLAGALAAVTGRDPDPAKGIQGALQHTLELVRGEPNQTVYYQTSLDRLAVAVDEEAPYRIDLVPPKVPLVQGGTMSLKVVATRKPGFTAPIRLSMLYAPPGVGAPPEASIPENGGEGFLTLSAEAGADPRAWKVAVVAVASVDGGDLWASTAFIDLEIAPPFVQGQIRMTALEKGQTGVVVCALDQRKPFEGAATVRLLGLPAKVQTQDRTITRTDKEVLFPVTIDAEAPAGQHKSLFCAVDVPLNGERMAHSIAGGGTLRIDPPPTKPETPAPAAAKTEALAPAPAAPRALSRLEQLRQRQGGGG